MLAFCIHIGALLEAIAASSASNSSTDFTLVSFQHNHII